MKKEESKQTISIDRKKLFLCLIDKGVISKKYAFLTIHGYKEKAGLIPAFSVDSFKIL